MPNRFLSGGFAPVQDELNVIDLPVEGALPPDLNGILMRNGPNPVKPDPEHPSWILGDGMIHAFELREGRAVSYRNRWVRTDQASEELGEQPPGGQPDRLVPPDYSMANTNVIAHAGRILALEEVCLPVEVDRSLCTMGRFDFGGKLKSAMTAHPKTDPETGELVFFGYDPAGPPFLRVHIADRDGELTMSQDVDIPRPTLMHDFAITQNHIVLIDGPVVYEPGPLKEGAGKLPLSWRPEFGTRVGVLPRTGGATRWFEVETCFAFHTVNAYEEGNEIVVDVIRHATIGEALPTTLDRWRVDLTTGRVREERLDDNSQEFPRLDDRRLGRPHTIAYCSQTPIEPGEWTFGGLLKHDLRTGRLERSFMRPGEAAGEPVFAPAGAGEEDGWILSVVYDANRDGSDLIVVDASDFTAPPVARVRLPQRVPFGFHGNWMPDA
ncbi:carotenoid oxygenase family protein [Nonomuraea sp. NPDC050643]|uniref:carotenoid oxygenase family protein n=1 Tax=Nonomuraea sp. NPDC050643 TaxID=3155660 RepID=UPI00340F011D